MIPDIAHTREVQTMMQSVKFLEHQVIAMNKEWGKYQKEEFTDWNAKFKGLKLSDIKPYTKIPQRDERIEKEEYRVFWNSTIEMIQEAIKFLKKRKKVKAIESLFRQMNPLQDTIENVEKEERETYNFLIRHEKIFAEVFDNNFGRGFFEQKLKTNFEMRFQILGFLKNEFDLIKYFLSDLV